MSDTPSKEGAEKPPDGYLTWLDVVIACCPNITGAKRNASAELAALRAAREEMRERVESLMRVLADAERIICKINGPLQSTLHYEAGRWLGELDKVVKPGELDDAAARAALGKGEAT